MSTLTTREYRELKKAAKEFARTAQPGRVYYIVVMAGGVRFVGGFNFFKVPRIGLDAVAPPGPSPEHMWLHHGPIYSERDHRDIRNLRTWSEHHEDDAKYEAMLLGSPEWADEVAGVAVGTRFRRQF